MSSGKGGEVRKIQLVGKSSLAVTLPKRWVEALNLRPGDSVYLEHRGHEIAVIPLNVRQYAESRRVIVVQPGDTEGSVVRRVISSFLKGVQSIVVTFPSDFNKATIERIIDELSLRIPMAEVVSSGEGKISVTVLAPTGSMPLSGFVLRMSNVVAGMFRDALSLLLIRPGDRKSMISDILDRDYDVDRSYLLIHRLINMAMNGLLPISSIGLSDKVELLSYLLVSKSIERSGDHAWRIAQWMSEVDSVDSDVAGSIVSLGNDIVNLHKDAVQAFISKDVDKAQGILDVRDEVASRRIKVNELLRRHGVAGPINLILESVGRLAAYAYDIAEITLDTYS